MIKMVNVGRVIAGTALVGSSLAVINVGAAHAVDCSQHFGDKDANSVLYTAGSVPYHTGPGGACAVKSNRSGRADIHCWKYNEYGNVWYYARDISSGTIGWVWSGNVSSTAGGPHARC